MFCHQKHRPVLRKKGSLCYIGKCIRAEILPHNEQISRTLYLCKDEDLKEKKYMLMKTKLKKQKKKERLIFVGESVN